MMYYQYDGLRNVSAITDRHGDLIEQYRYDAFGGLFTGITAPYNTSSFTGHSYDPKAGLVDMNARWYSPSEGRFTTTDQYRGEMLTPYTQNRYAYVGNNPVNRWDPLGYWQAGDETLSTQAQIAIRKLTDLWYDEEDYEKKLSLNAQADQIRQLDRSRTYFNTEELIQTSSDDNTQYAARRKGSTGWYTDWIRTVNEYKEYNIYSNAKNDYTGEIVSKILIGDRTDTTTTTINGTDFKPFEEKEWFVENKHWLDSYGGPPITYRPAKGYSKAGSVTANNVKGSANMYKLDIISSKVLQDKGYEKAVIPKLKDNTGLPLKSVVDSETYNHLRYLADKGKMKVAGNQGTGNSINVVSPVWQSSDANYSPAVQSMLLELNFDWYFADSIEEQNRIVQGAKDIRADVADCIEWWIDKAGKITSAAADEFSWFLGGSSNANERDKWLEMNRLFQSDLTIKDNQSLKAGMFIAGILMPGPGSGEANAAGRVLKSWIKHGTYNEVKETLGKEGVEQFIKAMNKGIVGGVKENGIKLISGEGIEAGGKYYKYELKVLGKGTSHYRILGNYDEKTGHVIFEKFVNFK